jgi:lipopolysaccharide transport system permease protein
MIAVGFGLWFGAAAARYRDFNQLSGFILQAFHLLSPLGYSSAILSERLGVWVFLYYANPLVAVIDLTRWCVLPAGAATLPDPSMIAISLGFGLILLFTGQLFFRHCERTFADVI